RPGSPKGGGATLAVGIGIGVVLLILAMLAALRSDSPATRSPSVTSPREMPAPLPSSVAPPSRVRSPAELREEDAVRKLEDIRAVEKTGRFAPDEIRRRYTEFARDYADTPQGRAVAGRLEAAVPPKPAELLAVEVKPE